MNSHVGPGPAPPFTGAVRLGQFVNGLRGGHGGGVYLDSSFEACCQTLTLNGIGVPG
jgi:hypothetical protein